MSGITIVVHPCWLEGAQLEAFQAMVTHGTGVYVQQDLSAKAIPLDEWLAGKRQTKPVLDKALAVAMEPPATAPNRPYYRRGRW